jgi:hypothetical protein
MAAGLAEVFFGSGSIGLARGLSLVSNGVREAGSWRKVWVRESVILNIFGTRTFTPMSQSAVNASHMNGFNLSDSSKCTTDLFLSSYAR